MPKIIIAVFGSLVKGESDIAATMIIAVIDGMGGASAHRL
jgi:hypothetical protein